MRNRSAILVLLLSISTASARESKILNYIGNFVPSLTEVGVLTNCVNVYDKVSNFVRVTNKLVHSVGKAKSDWERLRSNIEEIYEDVSYLKEIDPYDMDSWQEGLSCFSFSLKSNMSDAVYAFEMLNGHTIGASEEYVRKVKSIAEYKKAFNKKKEQIQSIYQHPSYRNNLLSSSDAIRKYRSNTIARLRSLQSADLLILQTSQDKNEREQAQAHFDLLEDEITSMENTISSEMQMEKSDSIIEQTSNLIAINLTEIKVCNEKIEQMHLCASNMVTAFYRLKDGSLNSQSANENAVIPQITIDPQNYDANDPDKVAAPVVPDMPVKEITLNVKNVSNHDILSLHNGAAFLALKQESLKRDILAMKVNTMAFIVAMEAFRRNNRETSALAMAHNCRMLEIAMEDLQ